MGVEKLIRKFRTDNSPRVEMPSEGKPYPIRAHHLFSYKNLDQGFSPAQIASAMIGNISWRDREYRRDVLGDSEASAATVESQYRELLQTYKELPNNHPIAVLVNEKDRICGSCIHGAHCVEKPKKDGYQADGSLVFTVTDITYMEELQRAASRIGVTDYVAFSGGEVSSLLASVPKQMVLAKGTFRLLIQSIQPVEYF